MAKAYASLQVVIGTATGEASDRNLEMDAVIVDADNNDVNEYQPGSEYLFRLYKDPRIVSVISFANFGSVSYRTSDNVHDVVDEVVVFTGSSTASLQNILRGAVTLTRVGLAYTKNGVELTPTITSVNGSKTLTSLQDIWAVYLVSYRSLYDQYAFQGNRLGTMLITCIGDDEA